MSKFVVYRRVSTTRQGMEGLGMGAQDTAVRAYAEGRGEIIETFTEVESGRNCARPALGAALAKCRRNRAVLLVAKLDRLARDVHFISGLMKAGVEFVACDMPHANKLTVHILAAVAEDEAQRIGERTRAALAAARERGVKLGGDRGYVPSAAHRALGSAAITAQAKARASEILPLIDELRAEGITSNNGLANALNARGITTTRGGKWAATQVARVLAMAA